MPEMEQKKRQLRLGKGPKTLSKLFNFESVNPLIYKDSPILLRRSSEKSFDKDGQAVKYNYFGPASRPPTLSPKDTDLKYDELLLPRRQRLKLDPLADEHYMAFHRRMKREEKSMTGADRNNMLLEIENLKVLLKRIRQHDWIKHLPKITVVNDSRNLLELEQKRQFTDQEILRLLAKHQDWMKRDCVLQNDIRAFEKYEHYNGNRLSKGGHRHETNDDYENESASDSDETMLSNNLSAKIQERQARTLQKYGPKIRLILHNGFEIVGGPLERCRIERVAR